METEDEAIVKARAFSGFQRKKVLYFPGDSSSHLIGRALKRKAIKEKNLGFGQLYLLKDKVILYQSVGAPVAVLSLEGLVSSGAKEIILLGFCGSLNSKFQMKSVASISKAFSEEGTSKHYFSQKKYFKPSFALKNKIEKILRSFHLPFSEGSLVSTDAPCRETKTWLEQKQKKGIDLVDMETSAVFALAEFRSIESAALMIVSDELWRGKWIKGFSDPGLDAQIEQYFLPFL